VYLNILPYICIKSNTMKKLITLLLVLISLNGYTQSKEVIEYHEEIANNSEFSNSKGLYFYKKDVKIYLEGNMPDYLKEELDSIIKELNDLIIPIEIYYVDNKEESNMELFLGGMDKFIVEYKKEHERSFLNSNWGLFWIYREGTEITNTTVFIDTKRCTHPNDQKHLLREEVTQAFGLRNDSYKYPESMFYSRWPPGISTTEYSDLDKEIIKYHYNILNN